MARIPKYRLQKTKSGPRAFVELGGTRHYLGVHGSPESRERYGRLLAEWEAGGGQLAVPPNMITITELTARYWAHAGSFYIKDGEPTSELGWIPSAFKPLVVLCGSTRAVDFGPLGLKSVRPRMIAKDQTRKAINARVDRIRRMFKWATSNAIIGPRVYEALRSVTGLREGRSEARESSPVLPVPEEHVEAVLPHVTAPVRAMIEVQLYCGCRPGEARLMRGCDLTMDGEIWEYRPRTHKTQHHGIGRVVLLGPRAVDVVKPFLKADLSAFLFSPLDVPGRAVNVAYGKNEYAHAVARGCRLAGVPHWSPKQLRHLSGTKIRREAGLEGAPAFWDIGTLEQVRSTRRRIQIWLVSWIGNSDSYYGTGVRFATGRRSDRAHREPPSPCGPLRSARRKDGELCHSNRH